jgi:hypothetical protein
MGAFKSGLTEIEVQNGIYKQVNYINSIPFKINKDVLNFILRDGKRLGLILHGLHPKTDCFNELTKTERTVVLSHNSRYFHERNILGLALLFKDVDKFYIPTFFD